MEQTARIYKQTS